MSILYKEAPPVYSGTLGETEVEELPAAAGVDSPGTEVETTDPGATAEVQVGVTPPTTSVVEPAGRAVLTAVVAAPELSVQGTAVVIVVVMVVGV